MLKLKLQNFGHLMRRADSLEKILMLGKNEGKRRRRWQRMKWLDSMIDSTDMNWSKLWETVEDRRVWRAAVMGSQRVGHDWATEQQITVHCRMHNYYDSILFLGDLFSLALSIASHFVCLFCVYPGIKLTLHLLHWTVYALPLYHLRSPYACFFFFFQILQDLENERSFPTFRASDNSSIPCLSLETPLVPSPFWPLPLTPLSCSTSFSLSCLPYFPPRVFKVHTFRSFLVSTWKVLTFSPRLSKKSTITLISLATLKIIFIQNFEVLSLLPPRSLHYFESLDCHLFLATCLRIVSHSLREPPGSSLHLW